MLVVTCMSYSNNKIIAKNTMTLYLRMFLTMIVGLYTSRVVLATLGVEDFGIYSVVGGIVSMLSFINAAMSLSTSRFLTFEIGRGDVCRTQKVFSTAFEIHMAVSLLILFLAETVGLWFVVNKLVISEDRMIAAMWVYQCSILSMIVCVTQVPYNAVIISHEKMNVYAYVELLNVFLKLLVVYFLLIGKADRLILYAVLQLCVSIFIALIYRIYSKIKYEECRITWMYDKHIIKPMLGFTVWSILGNVSYIGLTQGVNILLNLFFGPVVNSARAVAVQVQTTLNSFWTNFLTAINPQIIKSYASNEVSRLHELVSMGSLYAFFLMLIFTVPVISETPYLLKLWLNNVPDYTVVFVRLALLLSLIDCISEPLVNAIKATGVIKIYQIVVSIILLSILPISYILFKHNYPPFYVYIINIVISVLCLFVRVYFVNDIIGLSMRYFILNVIMKAFMIGGLSFTIAYILKLFFQPYGFLSTFTFCIFLSFITVCLVFFLGLKKKERKMVYTYSNKFFTKD